MLGVLVPVTHSRSTSFSAVALRPQRPCGLLLWGRELRTSTSTFTQLLSSVLGLYSSPILFYVRGDHTDY